MLNGYKKTNTTPFISKVMLDMQKMETELNEHRYYLERNVERRTEHLLKRIAALEACNATLCDKLTLARKEFAALKQQPVHTSPKEDTEGALNNQPQHLGTGNEAILGMLCHVTHEDISTRLISPNTHARLSLPEAGIELTRDDEVARFA